MAKNIKMNSAETYESINVYLSKEKTPIAYQNKLDELMDSKAFDSKEEAEKWINETPFELELYYENGYGLFGVEAEAVECATLHSPYSNADILDEDEIDLVNYDDKEHYSNNYIQYSLNDDLVKYIIDVANNSQENSDEKIMKIRNTIFKSITGKNLK